MGRDIFDTGSQYGGIGGSTQSAKNNSQKNNNWNMPSVWTGGPSSSASKVTTPVGSVSTAFVGDRASLNPTYNGYTIIPDKSQKIQQPDTGRPGTGEPRNYGTGAGSSGDDYLTILADLFKQQFDAQEQARLQRKAALEKSNNENAARAIGLYNNTANRNDKTLRDMASTGTSGALLSQRLQNGLWRGNGIHNAINDRDVANANGEATSWDQYANNISTLANNINNLYSANYALGDDALSNYRKRIGEIYGSL